MRASSASVSSRIRTSSASSSPDRSRPLSCSAPGGPDLPLLAETSGKNAVVVAPSADLDLAVADLVKSAFGHAGQKCSAASLVILVGPVGRSKRFARQLVDAVRSLHVGWPTDALNEVGPVIEKPQGKLAWALSALEDDEQWLIKPATVADDGGAPTGPPASASV